MSKVAYRKSYKVRAVGTGGYEVVLPKEIVSKAARERGMSISEFLKKHRLVHLYNDFEGIDGAYRFEPEETEEIQIPAIE